MNNFSSLTRRITLWLIAGVLALPLIAHLYAGLSNRPLTDDFCFTVQAQNRGILGALDYWYNAWTGTYSSTFFQSVIGLGELWRFTPILLILLWVLALTWAIYQGLLSLHLIDEHTVRLPLSFGLAALLLSAIVNSTLNVYQTVYWTSGAITYSLPLIVLTFNLGLFVRTVRRSAEFGSDPAALALTAGLAMLAGGFSPLFSVVHVALWFFLLVGSGLFLPKGYRRAGMTTAFVGLAFAGIAFLILLIAPGNEVRRSRFPESSPLWPLIQFNMTEVQKFLSRSRYWIAPLLAFGIVGAWLRLFKPDIHRGRWWAWLAGLLVFLVLSGGVLIFCGYFAGVYAMNYAPPPRSEIVMRTVFLSTVCAVGWMTGTLTVGLLPISRRVMWPVLAIVSAVAVILVVTDVATMTNRTLDDARSIALYAQEWDALDRRLDEVAGDESAAIVVEPFTVDFADMARVSKISSVPEQNVCLRDYYRIGSIRTVG
jgi:hypothetical protein